MGWRDRQAGLQAGPWASGRTVGGRASQSLPLAAGADAERALDRRGVERPHRHAGVHQRDQQRVREQVVGVEAPLEHPREHRLLDRGAHHVGVEADVSVEHAVGGGHRPLAQADRVRPRPAVGELPQPRASPPAGSRSRCAATAARVCMRRNPGSSSSTSRSHHPRVGSAPGPPRGGLPGRDPPGSEDGDARAHRGGLHPRARAPATSSSTRARSAASEGGEQRLALHHPARVGEGELGAGRHLVERRQLSFGVDADRDAVRPRERTSARSAPRSPLIATAAKRTPGEAAGRAPASRRAPRRSAPFDEQHQHHRAPFVELADVEDLRAPHRARRAPRRRPRWGASRR